jgi:hypothetical protein
MTVPKLTLNQQLESLARAIAVQQRELDDHYRQDLEQFQAVCALAQGAPLQSLLRALAPSRLVTTEATLDTRMFVSFEQASELRVRLATLGLQKRYERTTQAQLRLQCSLTVRPRSPHADT